MGFHWVPPDIATARAAMKLAIKKGYVKLKSIFLEALEGILRHSVIRVRSPVKYRPAYVPASASSAAITTGPVSKPGYPGL